MVELFQKTAALEASAWGLPLFPWKATCFVCSLVGVRKLSQTLLVPLPDSGECCLQSLSISTWSGCREPLEAFLLCSEHARLPLSGLSHVEEKAERAQQGCASVPLEMSFSIPWSHCQLLWATSGLPLAMRRICSDVSVMN